MFEGSNTLENKKAVCDGIRMISPSKSSLLPIKANHPNIPRGGIFLGSPNKPHVQSLLLEQHTLMPAFSWLYAGYKLLMTISAPPHTVGVFNTDPWKQ